MSIRVYLAGKISGTSWRQWIFPQIDSYIPRLDEDEDAWGNARYRLPVGFCKRGPRRGEYEYAGPYWLKCLCTGEHGSKSDCYNPGHGLGADEFSSDNHGRLCGPDGFSYSEVVRLCLGWINQADAMFVWFDDPDVHGTMVEMGYAKAKGIPIWVYTPEFDDSACKNGDDWRTAYRRFEERYDRVWDARFAFSVADYQHSAHTPEDAFRHFEKECAQRLGVLLLKRMPYDKYLQTDHWKERKRAALAQAEYRCQLCNADKDLNVHHRTYERRGEELLTDLTVLCGSCHAVFHGNRKLATSKLPSEERR